MSDQEDVSLIKKFIWWFIGVMFVVGAITWFLNRTERVANYAIIKYEEFQEIMNTCDKLNTDLCRIKEISENDKMFEQFSKAQRINAIQTNLNRWVEEYNAKSKMWNRSLWKSSSLPYQLSTQQFNCY